MTKNDGQKNLLNYRSMNNLLLIITKKNQSKREESKIAGVLCFQNRLSNKYNKMTTNKILSMIWNNLSTSCPVRNLTS